MSSRLRRHSARRVGPPDLSRLWNSPLPAAGTRRCL